MKIFLGKVYKILILKKREIDGLLDACKSYNLKTGLILTEDEEGEEISDERLEN